MLLSVCEVCDLEGFSPSAGQRPARGLSRTIQRRRTPPLLITAFTRCPLLCTSRVVTHHLTLSAANATLHTQSQLTVLLCRRRSAAPLDRAPLRPYGRQPRSRQCPLLLRRAVTRRGCGGGSPFSSSSPHSRPLRLLADLRATQPCRGPPLSTFIAPYSPLVSPHLTLTAVSAMCLTSGALVVLLCCDCATALPHAHLPRLPPL